MDDRLRENGCRGGAVAGELASLDGDLLQHLRADVLKPIGKLDFLRDRNPVLADPRGPERLVEKDVAAFWPQRDLDRVRQNIDPAQHLFARSSTEPNFFRRHRSVLRQAARAEECASPSITPITSLSFIISRSSSSIITSVPDHLPNRTRSPTRTSSG